ncbi:chloride channel [Dactylonectria estremocensis]|uniref:Chloride channel protein n=1 Tax=Dactylonectria estremocensis TaxID=1079267 RepID=A0A9P9EPG2_9HYPO|nr:chloride channel [Dactylonectria estremocensis]
MEIDVRSGETHEATEVTPLISRSRPCDENSETDVSTSTTVGGCPTDMNYVGESLPYKEYATVDWLQDLVKDGEKRARFSRLSRGGIRDRLAEMWDAMQGWVAAVVIGLITASIASVVDVSVETVADWKDGYCTTNVWRNRRACSSPNENGGHWISWSENFGSSYLIYIGLSVAFALIAGGLTMTTKVNLPTAGSTPRDKDDKSRDPSECTTICGGKTMYMAAGSGIPEIKSFLAGFDIPGLFDLKVLIIKAIGATFAVPTGMCLGKEGPFVHISACVGYLMAMQLPKVAASQRKLREMLSVACSAGLSVAFGAPIGGVLFSYEEISTYFPRQVLWQSCLCSVIAAAVLKELDPTGTGKLVLFETNYGVNYDAVHYLTFIALGVCGGIFGGILCRSNFLWAQSFRRLSVIRNNPVFELTLVALITALLQYPNPLIRETGDIVMQRLLVDCNHGEQDWICQQEAKLTGKGAYFAWLISGTLIKLILTIITFGCKVPSGVIIPALDAGALFGRLIGQSFLDSSPGISPISPGIFAMVGSAAFLAGVSRMTVSLAVIMFELTGEVNFIPPFMIAILTAKWVADCICREGIYELSQHILGHPFLDPDQALAKVRKIRESGEAATVELLVPPASIMEEMTLSMRNYKVSAIALRKKLDNLKARGVSGCGLVVVNEHGRGYGYIPELENALRAIDQMQGWQGWQGTSELSVLDSVLFEHIERNPLSIPVDAPLEIAVELFSKLGTGQLIVADAETAKVIGVVVRKRLLQFLNT